METVLSREFGELFDRLSGQIDLQGCTTAALLEAKLIEVRDMHKTQYNIAKESVHARVRAKAAVYARKAEQLDTLIENNFAGRTIYEAGKNPRGMIAMTLKYGKQEARRRILARQRAELRYTLAQRGIGRGLGVQRRIQKIPEYRRIPTYRRRRQWF